MANALETLQSVQGKLGEAVGTLFKKNMTDLVRGIRANKDTEAKYISAAMQEIKEELASQEKDEKANAVMKLAYLQMYGYDMGWAAFRMIEVIAQPKFSHKRTGYLAASQCFNESTDVMVLATNLIRKDCLSHQMYDAGIAINCLANICTAELARDLVPDIVSMVTSARPYTRKKAVLVLYKIFLKFPDALRPTFTRLREKLEDADSSVVCAAVNVICELARKNAKNYLPLAPQLYKLLTSSSNNWMLIKIIKLFAVLCPLEERLAKKLAEPLSNIINTTNAMSLLYEAIQCCILGLSTYPNIMRLCASKLRMFVEHPDPNLKYLGLLALSKIMVAFPKGILEHRDLILSCLEDEDTTIRSRALDLVVGMVDKKNISFIIDKLKQFMEQAEGPYRSELLEKIIFICSLEKYKNIGDFEWYLSVLMDLSQYKNCNNYSLIRDQFIDVCVRVQLVRAEGVKSMLVLLQDQVLFAEDTSKGGMNETLYAAAYIVGEYAELCEEKEKAIDLLTRPLVLQLPAHIQAIFLQATLKVLVSLGQQLTKLEKPLSGSFAQSLGLALERLPPFMASADLEVQDRACLIEQILRVASEQGDQGAEIVKELASILTDALNPVSAQAQSRVKPPEGLDLDKWIHEPLKVASKEAEIAAMVEEEGWGGIGSGGYGSSAGAGRQSSSSGIGNGGASWTPNRQLDEEDIRRRAATRRAERAAKGDVYFITDDVDEFEVPVRELSADVPTQDLSGGLVDRGRGRGRGGRGRGGRGRGGPAPRQMQEVHLVEEVNPDGWTGDEAPAKSGKPKDALANISLDEGEDDNSALQHKQHRIVASPSAAPKSPAQSELKLATSSSSSSPQASPSITRGAPAPRSRGAAPRGGRGAPARGGRGGAHAPAARAPPRRPRPLLANDAVSVHFDVVVNKEKSDEATLILGLVNKAAVPLVNVAVAFGSAQGAVALNVKGAVAESASVQLAGLAVAPNAAPQLMKQTLNITGPITAPSSLKGTLSFRLDGAENDSSADFTLELPSSLFILPANPPLDAASFFNLLRTKATETRTGRLVGALPKALDVICSFYNVRIIERDDLKGSAYGVTAQGHHVAFLVKQDGEPTKLAVAIKSNSADLASTLAAELDKVKELLE